MGPGPSRLAPRAARRAVSINLTIEKAWADWEKTDVPVGAGGRRIRSRRCTKAVKH